MGLPSRPGVVQRKLQNEKFARKALKTARILTGAGTLSKRFGG